MKLKKKLFAAVAVALCFAMVTPAMAASKTMYVISKIENDGPFFNIVYKMKYNSGGLLKKYTIGDNGSYNLYHYDNDGKLTRMDIYINGQKDGMYNYYYTDGVGSRTKYTSGKTVENYKYKWTGKTKCRVTGDYLTPMTFTFDAEGKPAKWDLIGLIFKFTFDAKGFLTKIVVRDKDTNKLRDKTEYKNTYKSGRLSEIVYMQDEGYNFVTITYKKITVPNETYANLVAKQQLYILRNQAIGDWSTFFIPAP
ncbi:MAG: hypothetical protein IJ899_04500 [Blautia sp.]|nr:hypothetical protein [Blautia sp.]